MNQLKTILNYLLVGVLAVIPIVIVLEVVVFLKNMVSGLITSMYGYYESYLVAALAFSIVISVLCIVGYRVKHHKSYIIMGFEHVVQHIPFLNSVYRITKKLISMVKVEDKAGDIREVVYIEYPKDGLWVPGYVTNKKDDMYIIYVPTSPNPTSGFTIIVHESKVVKSDMSLEDVTSFIVSVGVDYNKDAEILKIPKS